MAIGNPYGDFLSQEKRLNYGKPIIDNSGSVVGYFGQPGQPGSGGQPPQVVDPYPIKPLVQPPGGQQPQQPFGQPQGFAGSIAPMPSAPQPFQQPQQNQPSAPKLPSSQPYQQPVNTDPWGGYWQQQVQQSQQSQPGLLSAPPATSSQQQGWSTPTFTPPQSPLKQVPQQQAPQAQGINPPNSRLPSPPKLGQVQSAITPRDVYTPQMTQYAANQARAQHQAAADPRYAMKQFQRPGVSMDEGTLQAAMPSMANAQLMGQQAAAAIPLQDMFANQQNRLAGEIARENEGLGMGNLLANLQQDQIANRNRQLQPMFGLLNQMFGGGF